MTLANGYIGHKIYLHIVGHVDVATGEYLRARPQAENFWARRNRTLSDKG